MLPKVHPRNTNQIAYEELKKAIISGVLQPGVALVERDLAEQMGISRTPVHEAINRLESEHLAMRLPNKRVVVAEISLEDLIHLYTIRTDLEVLAVRWSMPRTTSATIDKLKKNLARMVQYGKAEDLERVLETNVQFHRIIMETASSWYLSMFLEKIHDSVRLFRGQSVYLPGRVEAIIRDHENIIRAFQDRDETVAINYITAHLQGALDGLIAQYRHIKTQEREDIAS